MTRTRRSPIGVALTAALAFGLGLTAGPAAGAPSRNDARCIAEAAQLGLLGPERNPGNTAFIGGTDEFDIFGDEAGPTVICGFGGADGIYFLYPGVTFIGGDGNDHVAFVLGGTYIGGDGNDDASVLHDGTCIGGADNDTFGYQTGGTFVQD